ncbi:DUF362 domain-containing protein [bacterium]|nr:DUF362 domain-containing protein [bacterium]
MSDEIFSICEDYDVEKIRRIFLRMLENLDYGEKIRSGERILLKPNLLAARKPHRAITTHPAVVEAVASVVIDLGATPVISDSPGGAIRGAQRVLNNTGMNDVAKRLNIKTIPLETKGANIFTLPDGEKLFISKIVEEVDGIINLPKMKTHSLTLTTFATKNLYGLVPGFRKAEFHKIYPTPRKFARLIVEVYKAVREKIRLNFIDGIVGMDGNGPSSGDVRKIGILGLSDDTAAMDAALEKIIGLKSPAPITIELKRQNLLPDFAIEWLDGIPAENINLKIPSNWAMRFVPAFITRSLGALVQVYPDVDEKKCIKCGDCKNSCPVSAISMEAGKTAPQFDYKKCIRCLCCHEICPTSAVIFKKSWLAKFIK